MASPACSAKTPRRVWTPIPRGFTKPRRDSPPALRSAQLSCRAGSGMGRRAARGTRRAGGAFVTLRARRCGRARRRGAGSANFRPRAAGDSQLLCCPLQARAQRSFPSVSIKRTPISFNASDSLAISARGAASSGSTRPWRTPGRDAASASNAPCFATDRSFTIVGRSTPARSAAFNRRAFPAQQPDPDLVLLRRREKPLHATDSVAAC